jgi:kynurenine formamidase
MNHPRSSRTSGASEAQPTDSAVSKWFEPWWPSRYGPKDTVGAMNELTPAKVVEGLKLVGNGCVYDVATIYGRGIPSTPSAFWETVLITDFVKHGSNLFQGTEHVWFGYPTKGTHLGGLGHVSIDGIFYNGYKMTDVFDANGIKMFGVENFKPILTRGVLIDAVAQNGHLLEAGEGVTVADVEGFLKKNNLEVRPGDAVLIRTGWHRHLTDGEYVGPEPGITKDLAKWLYDKRVVVVGTDNWATEQIPGDDPNEVMPVQQLLATKYGIYTFRYGVFDELAEDKLYEFCFVFTCPKTSGATQGIGRPIVIGNGPGTKVIGPPTIHPVKPGTWYPTRYGAEDENGTMNEVTSAKVIEAVKAVKEGKIYDLGKNYDDNTPVRGIRYWHNRVLASSSPTGTNKFQAFDDLMHGCGAMNHLEGFAHNARDDRFYNGFPMQEVLTTYRLLKFGMERIRPLVTRAVFLNMEEEFGRPLEGPEQVKVSHIEHLLQTRNLEVRPGDALLLRIPSKPTAEGRGGVTKEVTDWYNEKRISFVGYDGGSQVSPQEDPTEVVPLLQQLCVRYGIHSDGSLALDELAKDKVGYCFLIYSCPKILFASQGIGRPIVIV